MTDTSPRVAAGRPARRRSPSVPTILLIATSVYFVMPLWWLFVAATKTQGDLALDSGFWFSRFRLADNLTVLFGREHGVFWHWLLNSLIYAGFGAATATVLSAMAGYAISRYRFRGRELVFSIVLAGVLVPATALALPLFLLFSKVHLTNTYASVLLPGMVSPFGVYLARIYSDAAVPEEVIEAARVDGASEQRIFFTIAARLMRPALVTLFLFQFVGIWNNFFLPLIMLNDRGRYPVTLGLYTWAGQFIQDPTLITSVVVGSFVSLIPILVGFLLLQRHWRAGLASGSVKA